MSILDIAQSRKGKLRDGYSAVKSGVSAADTRVEYGTAVASSSGGYVTIRMDNAPTDGTADFSVPCDTYISAGDRVSYISSKGRGKAVSVATVTSMSEQGSTSDNERMSTESFASTFYVPAEAADMLELRLCGCMDQTIIASGTGFGDIQTPITPQDLFQAAPTSITIEGKDEGGNAMSVSFPVPQPSNPIKGSYENDTVFSLLYDEIVLSRNMGAYAVRRFGTYAVSDDDNPQGGWFADSRTQDFDTHLIPGLLLDLPIVKIGAWNNGIIPDWAATLDGTAGWSLLSTWAHPEELAYYRYLGEDIFADNPYWGGGETNKTLFQSWGADLLDEMELHFNVYMPLYYALANPYIETIDFAWKWPALPPLPYDANGYKVTVTVGSGLPHTKASWYGGTLSDVISSSTSKRTGGILYGSVDNTSTSTAYTATVDGLESLYDGACVMLHNGVVTSAAGFTVNINNLGAKKCYNNMTNATQDTTIFNADYTMMFVYSSALDSGNGGFWIYRGYDSSGGSKQCYYATCSTDASTQAKEITIAGWTPAVGDILLVKFTTANTHNTPKLKINGTSYNITIGTLTVAATTNVLKWSANTTLLFMCTTSSAFSYITARAAASVVPPDGAGHWYGTSDTADGTAGKTATIDNFRLMKGATVDITFSKPQTSLQALTLNVNSTAAKAIYAHDSACSATYCIQWAAGETLRFVFSGSYWYVLNRDVVLYRDPTGVNANSSLTLSKSAANFSWLDFIYTDGSRTYTERLYQPDGKATSLMRMVNSGTVQYIDSLMVAISGTSVTTGNGMQSLLDSGVFSDTNCHINIIEIRGGY